MLKIQNKIKISIAAITFLFLLSYVYALQDGYGASSAITIISLENTKALCQDGTDNDGDGNTDCADTDCTGLNTENGLCCQAASDCAQDDCVEESCVSNVCGYTNRNQCDLTECPAGQYCDTGGGDCQTPDASSNVCLNCVPDKTSGFNWVWDNAETDADESNHEDAGKAFATDLFNSNADPCSQANGWSCYDSNNNPVSHKSALTTGNCCGDDASEFYKPDYHGPECTGDINDCVWSTGDTQASDTGNAGWWCFQHEWNECKDSTIGTKVGGVTCAGIAGSNAWTPNSLVLTENQYSCTDSEDNDGDGLTDCQDPDCAGSISGTVTDKDTGNAISEAQIDVTQFADVEHTVYTDNSGYTTQDPVLCTDNIGTYDIIASADTFISSTTNIQLQPKEQLQNVDFTLVPGTTCEDDCTYAGDNTIHQECDEINGCAFYDETAKQACNLAQPGWVRDYSETKEIECAEGTPRDKAKEKATVTCELENLIKTTKLVTYKGKLVKLVVVTCG